MPKKILLFLSLIAVGCTESWNSEQRTKVNRLSDQIREKILLHNEVTIHQMKRMVEEMGNRKADVVVIEEVELVSDHIIKSDSISFERLNLSNDLDEYILQTLRYPDLDEIGKSKFERVLLAEKVVGYYSQMIGIHHGFETPLVRLWQSVEDPMKFKTAAGGDYGRVTEVLLKVDDEHYEVVNPLLNKTSHNIVWKLIFEKPVIWHYEEE